MNKKCLKVYWASAVVTSIHFRVCLCTPFAVIHLGFLVGTIAQRHEYARCVENLRGLIFLSDICSALDFPQMLYIYRHIMCAGSFYSKLSLARRWQGHILPRADSDIIWQGRGVADKVLCYHRYITTMFRARQGKGYVAMLCRVLYDAKLYWALWQETDCSQGTERGKGYTLPHCSEWSLTVWPLSV